MSKHTPGPWAALKVEQAVHEQDYYIESERGVVGYWKGGKSWHDDDKWVLTEADARLISAAPELLDALEACLARITEEVADSEFLDEVEQARAAIAKATA
ncbi:hypothetical protein JTL84_12510 [Pseudomonas aeruginosa]|nr:hypothetical protein [Pseudomonas aeruginosa]MBH4119802.1 hypothetical protein [Pseudomonas aeruginosa]MBH9136752.1 hypothetical protein [Pseudomonas aeruginosa]MBM9949884.1 hypothetical protein [Pseudomonas aeruginosa]HEJ3157152.1 hypothetical protein [Pseudomonas aeruginosa]